MANTFKDNTKRTAKMSKIQLRATERKAKYLSTNRYFVSELLEQNPRIAYAYKEYVSECRY